jgi:serine/threonine-protein kinase
VVAGRYVLEHLISSSHMGAVYKATELETGATVALKLLWMVYADDKPDTFERFRREGVAASLIDHPNVVKVREHGRLDYGEAYIVMEYVEGQTLRQYIKQTPRVPLPTAVLIGWEVASGLESAHDRVVLHRDLKPENIMLARDGGGELLAKVIDFGLAKLKPSIGEIGLDSLTPMGMFLGTVQYSSPEGCKGLKLDARSDIYSLGVIMYEMLAGKRPFSGATLPELCQQHIDATPIPVGALRPDMPRELARLIMSALAKDAAERPQSASEFAGRLRRVARALNPPAFPPGHPILEPYSGVDDERSEERESGGRSQLPDQFHEIIVGPSRRKDGGRAPFVQPPQQSNKLAQQRRERVGPLPWVAFGVAAVSLIAILLVFFLYLFSAGER